jgi:hypothetical protein
MIDETVIARLLREYYNDAVEVSRVTLDDDLEAAIIALDEDYAHRIVEELK